MLRKHSLVIKKEWFENVWHPKYALLKDFDIRKCKSFLYIHVALYKIFHQHFACYLCAIKLQLSSSLFTWISMWSAAFWNQLTPYHLTFKVVHAFVTAKVFLHKLVYVSKQMDFNEIRSVECLELRLLLLICNLLYKTAK